MPYKNFIIDVVSESMLNQMLETHENGIFFNIIESRISFCRSISA